MLNTLGAFLFYNACVCLCIGLEKLLDATLFKMGDD